MEPPVGDATRPDDTVVAIATRLNTYRAVTPWFTSTAFRSHSDRHGHLDFGQPPVAAEEFLISTRLNPHDRETPRSIGDYLSPSFVPMVGATDIE